jgi:hypothetical protein
LPGFDPLAPVGMLFARQPDNNRLDFLGTCFLFRHDFVCLTAAHCVRGIEVERLVIVFPRLDQQSPVSEVRAHWTKDVAIVYLARPLAEQSSGYPESAFWDCVSNYGLGEEFAAYGYPEDSPAVSEGGLIPTARFFRGHFQRFFNYFPPGGHAWYAAGEMSLPAPAGLSGGPVFRPGAHPMLIGLVTANAESYTLRDYEERLEEPDSRHIFEARRIVAYGVVLLLDQLAYWLRHFVPAREGMAPIQGPDATTLEIGVVVHDLIERDGARYRDCYFFDDTPLVVHGYHLDRLTELTHRQLGELAATLGKELSLQQVDEGG